MIWTWLEGSKTSTTCGRNWWNSLIWENRHRFLTMCTLDALNVIANRTKVLLMNTEKMFESRISPGATEKLPGWETRSLGLLTWKGMRKMRGTIDIASQQINQSSNWIRYLHHVLTTINSKKKNWKRWENFKKSALKLSWHFCTWLELVDQSSCGWYTNEHEQSRNGHVTDAWLVWYLTFITRVITDQFCHVRSTTQHCRLGLFHDSNFVGNLWYSVYLQTSNIRSHQLDVQETNFRLSQLHWIWSDFFRCRSAHGWYTRSWFLGLGCWSVTFFLESTQSTGKPVSRWTIWKTLQRKNEETLQPFGRSNVDKCRLCHFKRKIISLRWFASYFWRQWCSNQNVGHVVTVAKPSQFEAQLYIFEDNKENNLSHSSKNQPVQEDLLRDEAQKETHQHQDEETHQPRWCWRSQCGSRYHEHKSFSFRRHALHFWRQWRKMIPSKAEVRRWDMCPVPTDSRSIGYLIDSI